VVPVLDALPHLRRTVPALLRAAERTRGVEIVYVDNGSTDGSLEFLQSMQAPIVRVLSRPGITIAALRNAGAALGHGAYLSFIDADCSIAESYFDEAIDVLGSTQAAATGCEVTIPEAPHWIEATLHQMHFVGRDREVGFINSGNFFVTRQAFDAVGGFREELSTGEGVDIGQRLIAAGFRMRECPRVSAVHHGNPHSVGEYYRANVWHGLDMFDLRTLRQLDRPTMMLLVHAAATIAGLVVLIGAPSPVVARIAAALTLQLMVPLATVAFRIRQTGRVPALSRAVFLYWLYYVARLHAGLLVAFGRTNRQRA